jgi:hypothetical protein
MIKGYGITQSDTGNLRWCFFQYYKDATYTNTIAAGAIVSPNGAGGFTSVKGTFKANNMLYTFGTGELNLDGITATTASRVYMGSPIVEYGADKVRMEFTVGGQRYVKVYGVSSIVDDVLTLDLQSQTDIGTLIADDINVDSVEFLSQETVATDDILIESIQFYGNDTGSPAQISILNSAGTAIYYRVFEPSGSNTKSYSLGFEGLKVKGGMQISVIVALSPNGRVSGSFVYKKL